MVLQSCIPTAISLLGIPTAPEMQQKYQNAILFAWRMMENALKRLADVFVVKDGQVLMQCMEMESMKDEYLQIIVMCIVSTQNQEGKTS